MADYDDTLRARLILYRRLARELAVMFRSVPGSLQWSAAKKNSEEALSRCQEIDP